MLDKIQTRFSRLLGRNLGYTFLGTTVSLVETQFQLEPLHARRICFDLVFLFKLVNGILDCPDLLRDIPIVVPRGTRSRTIFRRRFGPTYYAYHNGISRLLRLGSEAAPHADFFRVTVSSFKNTIMKNIT